MGGSMRGIMMISLVACLGCASSKPSAPAPALPTPEAVPPSIDPRVADAVPLTPTAMPAPPDIVWNALPAAYDSLGIRLNVVDPREHLIGNQGMKLRQRLGTTRLSKYIDCGNAQIGPSADSYDVLMSVMTHVGVNAQGVTVVSIRVLAAARPPAFSQDYRRCTSTGEIEKRMFELVTASIPAGH